MIAAPNTICVLPSGWRPVSTMYVVAKLISSSNINTQNSCIVALYADGSVQILNGTTTSGYHEVVIATTFIVN